MARSIGRQRRVLATGLAVAAFGTAMPGFDNQPPDDDIWAATRFLQARLGQRSLRL
ncbi:MAG TPA: hypothetical protein VMU33_12750 [Burkholderiaceae bacterium]|nr:hypothetical protein [Burkholderiaceae bacterium]